MSPMSVVRRAGGVVVHQMLPLLEPRLIASAKRLASPPVFILGPPRSGTTLLYQLLTTCLRFSYICNLANRFHDCPAATTVLLRRLIRAYRTDFASIYSRTRGYAGPSEGAEIWRKWFGWGYVDESDVTHEARREAYTMVAALERILDAPFVSKSPRHSTRIRALESAFHGCLFLRVSRDPLAMAQSILRRRRVGDGAPLPPSPEQKWWSVEPKQFESIKGKYYIDQICEQVYFTERNIIEDLAAVARGRCLEVEYTDLCHDPAGQLAHIQTFLARNNVMTKSRMSPPKRFEASTKRQVSEGEFVQLRWKIENLYGRVSGTL